MLTAAPPRKQLLSGCRRFAPAIVTVSRPGPNGARVDTPDTNVVTGLLGSLEIRVLAALRGVDEATVRDTLRLVNESRDQELAYTSVMTVLDRLHGKGLVARTKRGRAWLYRPAHDTEEALIAHLGRREVDDLVGRFGDVALAHFAKALDELDDRDLSRLRALADDDG